MKLTLDELITLMEPQAQRDKKLIVQCIDGLTEYAAELRQKAGDAGKAESSALRELIDRLEGYWGLDNSGENRLSAFDRRMREAEQSEQPWAPVQDQINGAVLGLYAGQSRFTQDGLSALREGNRMNSFRNIYASDLSHRARSVYMYLKDRADSEGRCWPAIKTIALELGLSRSTVKRALDDLVKAGLLRKDPRWRENGSLTSNLYHVV